MLKLLLIKLAIILLSNQWNFNFPSPPAKTVTPKSANEVKLIHSGRILENNKTLADSRITSANQPGGGAVIMHAVVQPLVPKQKKTG